MRRRLFATFAGIDALEQRIKSTDNLLKDMLALYQQTRTFWLTFYDFILSVILIALAADNKGRINPSC
jgi:uncharacterized membrane protein